MQSLLPKPPGTAVTPWSCCVLVGAQGRVHVHHLQAGKEGGEGVGGHVRHGRSAQVASPHVDCRPQGPTCASLWQEGFPARPAPPCLWALATQGTPLLLLLAVQAYTLVDASPCPLPPLPPPPPPIVSTAPVQLDVSCTTIVYLMTL